MALILKRNGAPLSGALFVKNPRRRRARKALRLNRRARRSTRFRTLGGLFARANGRKGSRRRAKKSGVLARLLSKLRMKRNAGYMLNRRRRGVKHNRRHSLRMNAGYLLNRRSRRARKNAGYMLNRRRRTFRKNTGYMLNRRRRHGMKRNPAFQIKLLAPVQKLASKFPVAGPIVASSLGYLAFGAGALATHYYGMKAVRYVGRMLPAPVRAAGAYVAPVGYSLLGVAANVALQKLPIPTVGPVTPQFRKNLGNAAMIVGAAIDLWRWLHNSSRDLGGDDYGDDYGDEYGDGGAYDVVGLGGIGLGGIAMGDVSDYADAEMADAYYSGPDLDGAEGEAALCGAHAYRAAFGAPPKVTRRAASPMSRHAGRRGHRWGWLIKLVGFDGFGRIAAMEPAERCALIDSLKAQALATVQARTAQQQLSSNSMSGIGFSGIGLSGIGLAGIGESGSADYGVLMAGSAY